MNKINKWLKEREDGSQNLEEKLRNLDVTEEMLWGRELSEEEIRKKERELINTMVQRYGFSCEEARQFIKNFND